MPIDPSVINSFSINGDDEAMLIRTFDGAGEVKLSIATKVYGLLGLSFLVAMAVAGTLGWVLQDNDARYSALLRNDTKIMVQNTTKGVHQARDIVLQTKANAERSGEVVRQAVAAMDRIEQSSCQIGQIIGVIDEIAFQANLLALNAGVEAARAGDAGRGFAVVACEMQALAQRSAGAAKEIKTLISTSAQQVGTGVKFVGEAGQSLTRITNQIGEINRVMSKIAASAEEQTSGSVEVNSAVNQMDQSTQQNAAMVEEATAACRSPEQEGSELVRLASHFSVDQPERAA